MVDEADSSAASLDASEYILESYRGSGAGGQHRNTTDSAVRVTHKETGISAKSESQRSWWQNKAAAIKELESRLADLRQVEAATSINNDRVEQIGVGDRPTHDWTWCDYRDTVTQHSTGKTWRMAKALKGKIL